jgi:hypothetical protein
MLLLIGGIVAIAGQLHQQIEAPRAVFVVAVSGSAWLPPRSAASASTGRRLRPRQIRCGSAASSPGARSRSAKLLVRLA